MSGFANAGSGAERVGRAIPEAETVRAGARGFHAQRFRRSNAEVADVDAEAIDERRVAFEVGGGEREVPDQQTATLVDLRAIHAVVAFEIEPAIADLQIERRTVCAWAANAIARIGRERQFATNRFMFIAFSYFSSCGSRLEPWIATWQVVQF